jgi:hypothetical protein
MTGSLLTADLIAHAVVASARVYGDDPVKALTSRGPNGRRCLTPAASGVLIALDLSPRTKPHGAPDPVSRALGLAPMSVYKARRARGAGLFEAAELAAASSVRKGLDDQRRTPPPPPAHAAPVECVAPSAGSGKSPVPAVLRKALAATSTPVRTILPAPPPEPPALSLPRRILEVLKDGPCNPPGLAVLFDAKDLAVSQTLAQLQREGKIVAGLCAEGQSRRDQMWRVV